MTTKTKTNSETATTSTLETPAMSEGMTKLLAVLPQDGSPIRVGGGVLGAARKLAKLDLVVIVGSTVAKVMPKTKFTIEEVVEEKPAKKAKPKKERKPSRAWPSAFPSKALIRERLRSDAQFKTDCVKIMGVRTGMRAANPSLTSCGFMSSHMSKGTECVRTVLDGKELSSEQWAWLAGAMPQYAAQLASHFREAAIEADPSLKAFAKVYGLKEAK
jgi:hypothetical protein